MDPDDLADPEVRDVDWAALFARLPEGWSEVEHDGVRWGASRTVQVGGRSQKVWAEELGGGRHVSANLYAVGSGATARVEVRPCEMPAAVVRDFLAGLEVVLPRAAARGSGPDRPRPLG